MIEDARDGSRLGDESNDLHARRASRTDQRIDFVDTAEQICAPLALGRGVGRRCCLGISGLGLVLGRLAAPSFSPGGARIIGIAGSLVGLVAAASYAPARVAGRLDPAAVLRTR